MRLASDLTAKEAEMSRSDKRNPYAGFKSDFERRRALVARDVRLTIIGVTIALSNSTERFKDFVYWISAMCS